jgi:hypothetical protein
LGDTLIIQYSIGLSTKKSERKKDFFGTVFAVSAILAAGPPICRKSFSSNGLGQLFITHAAITPTKKDTNNRHLSKIVILLFLVIIYWKNKITNKITTNNASNKSHTDLYPVNIDHP